MDWCIGQLRSFLGRQSFEFGACRAHCGVEGTVLTPAQDIRHPFALYYAVINLGIQALVAPEIGEERSALEALVTNYVRYFRFSVSVRHWNRLLRTAAQPQSPLIRR